MSFFPVVLLGRYQQMLHTNLVYLATIADSNQNMQSLLPAVSMEWCKTEGRDFIWATGVGKKVFKVLYSE